MNKKFQVISLFSGAGGLDKGFIDEGHFDIIFANDILKSAVKTYTHNINSHIICGNITEIKKVPKVDLIIGGPPCQGFSLANPHRTLQDPRNWLFKEYLRILKLSNPNIFLFENVRGILSLAAGNIFYTIKQLFADEGYQIYSKVVNASNYGVPQYRNRCIIIGIKKELNKIYQFPKPTTNKPITVGQVLNNPPLNSLSFNHEISKLSDLNIERIKYIPPGGSMKDCPKSLQNNSDLKRAMRRLHNDKPSYTIVHNNGDHYYHPTENRRLTIREMARIQTFPDDYLFFGSKNDQSIQVANAVPVKLATAFANSINLYLKNIQ